MTRGGSYKMYIPKKLYTHIMFDYDFYKEFERLRRKCKCSKIRVIDEEAEAPDTSQTNTFQILADDSVVFVACDGTIVEFGSGGGGGFFTSSTSTGDTLQDGAGFDFVFSGADEIQIIVDNSLLLQRQGEDSNSSYLSIEDGTAYLQTDYNDGGDYSTVSTRTDGITISNSEGNYTFDENTPTDDDGSATHQITVNDSTGKWYITPLPPTYYELRAQVYYDVDPQINVLENTFPGSWAIQQLSGGPTVVFTPDDALTLTADNIVPIHLGAFSALFEPIQMFPWLSDVQTISFAGYKNYTTTQVVDSDFETGALVPHVIVYLKYKV